jgi:hypothetical protein
MNGKSKNYLAIDSRVIQLCRTEFLVLKLSDQTGALIYIIYFSHVAAELN